MKALVIVALALVSFSAEAAMRKPHLRPEDRQMYAAPAQPWRSPSSWASPAPQPEDRTSLSNANGS